MSLSAFARNQPPTGEIAAAIRAHIDSGDVVASRVQRSELRSLYELVGYSPLWLDATGRMDRNARDALALIDRAADEGLVPADYQSAALHRLMLPQAASAPCLQPARFDVTLTASVLRYLRELHNGRVDPRAIGFRLTLPVDEHDYAALLRAALADHGIPGLAQRLEPPFAQYTALRTALARYRSLAADPALVAPPLSAKAVRPGDAYAGVRAIHRALVAFGDLSGDTPIPATDRYQDPLTAGVRRFQSRHGLAPDAVLGARTIAELQVPLSWRVRQIELALERLRWLPHLGARRLIMLNIPMFRLWAWSSIPPTDGPSLGMDAIVGRALRTQTPIFVEEMEEVIFRPYWNVPASILYGEILPKIARDPGYLVREDMEIVGPGGRASIADLRNGTGRLRQRPGPRNALGLIKFVFPNQENVYMHGTPAQALFARSRRDFSHGCVRVADPVALAEWVLDDPVRWSRDRIVAAAEGTESIHVKLSQPIQVILFYTTAGLVPEDGTIHFAEDIYRHDARLDRALRSADPSYSTP